MQLCPYMMDSQHMGQITTVSLSLVLLIQDLPSLQHVSKKVFISNALHSLYYLHQFIEIQCKDFYQLRTVDDSKTSIDASISLSNSHKYFL